MGSQAQAPEDRWMVLVQVQGARSIRHHDECWWLVSRRVRGEG